MAFPTISDADTTSGTVASNSTSWTLTYPANIAAGDLLLLMLASDGGGQPSITGWSVQNGGVGNGGAVSLNVQAKVGVGTETGTFTATISSTEQGAWRIFRIPAATWFGGLPSGVTSHDGTGFDLTAGASGATANPDPDVLDPGTWGTEDTLWIATCAIDTSRTISAYPLAGRNTADVSGGAGGATLGVCTTTSTVASLDPGTFTASASDDWGALTIGIRPAAAAAAQIPYSNPMPPLIAQ